MRLGLVPLLLSLFIVLIGGCTDQSPTRPQFSPDYAFKAILSIVVCTAEGGEPIGVEGIPVILTQVHQITETGSVIDTIATNQNGFAFLKETVGSTIYGPAGKLVIKIGALPDTTVYFENGDDVNMIVEIGLK